MVIIGDLNARLGTVSELENIPTCVSYTANPDHVCNSNGRKVRIMCESLDLLPVNHAQLADKCMDGNYTFKRKNVWISQLDWVLVSANLMKDVMCFDIVDNIPLKSDHAAIAITLKGSKVLLDDICRAASDLDSYYVPNKTLRLKPVKYEHIDSLQFINNLNDGGPIVWDNPDVIHKATEKIYLACAASAENIKHIQPITRNPNTRYANKWATILEEKDSKTLWKAVDWKGSINTPLGSQQRPSDQEFATYFSSLLNPETGQVDISIPSSGIYVPILDDDILPGEVIDEISRMKPRKAPGVDGIPPGALKLLSDEWILLITWIMNLVFHGTYPISWALAKMFVIYKKGEADDTNNYRGISIVSALPKLYDGILNTRFNTWYSPCIEQAGAQRGRSCVEQLLTLRLYMDIARKEQSVLYALFIDYIKAYDKVDRNKLLNMLSSQGCGDTFVRALGYSMSDTHTTIGSEKFKSTAGIKQGSAISCSLFTFYLDHTIRAVRQYGNDAFLQDTHLLLLMDDTVLLASSRAAMEQKLRLLLDSSKEIGMIIHPVKSKYIAVNTGDTAPFVIEDDNIRISHTVKYCYLGAVLSAAPLSKQVEDHIKNKQAHIWKFSSFLDKNQTAPFMVKQRVLQGAVNSALLYGCESWFTGQIKCIETAVLGCLKDMLGVRDQTPTDLVYVECGANPIAAEIKMRQIKFVKKILNRMDIDSSPLGHALSTAIQLRTPMGQYVSNHIIRGVVGTAEQKQVLMERISNANTTRMMTYRELNTDLDVHPVYSDPSVPELSRISFTRLRLSSHYLRVETGRWTRTPRADRLCACKNDIQTEQHVLLQCALTEPLRGIYAQLNFSDIVSLMSSADNTKLVEYCHHVLLIMNRNY